MRPIPQAAVARWSLLAAVLLLNLPALRGGFADPDDFVHLHAALGMARGDGAAWSAMLVGNEGYAALRPLAWAAWALNALVFGTAPWGYYATNLGLTVLLALAVFELAREVGRCDAAALAIAALALFSPATSQPVDYLAGRADLLANLLAVTSVWLFVARRSEARRRWLAAGLFGLALAAKVTAVTVPALLVLLELGRRGRGRWRDLAPFGLVLLAAGGLALAAADAGPLLTVEQERSLGRLDRLAKHVLGAALLPAVSRHGAWGLLGWDLPRLIALLWAVRGATAHPRLLRLGGAWLLLNLPLVAPFVVLDGFRLQDQGRYLQLPLIGFALLVGGLLTAQRSVRPALAIAAACALGYAGTVTPTLGRGADVVDGFLSAARSTPVPEGGRLLVGLNRPDRGVAALAASPLLQELVPGLPRPLLFLEGGSALLGDPRPDRGYGYGALAVLDPSLELALAPADRLLVQTHAGFARVELPPGTLRRPGVATTWDFVGGDAQGWTWRNVPRQLYSEPTQGERVAPAPAEEGTGLALWNDAFIPPSAVGRAVRDRIDAPHLASPALDLDPLALCGLELELTLGDRVAASRDPADALLPSGRFALVALGESAERLLLLPLSPFPGRQTARLVLHNSPTWLASPRITRLLVLPANVRGAVDLHAVRLLPCP